MLYALGERALDGRVVGVDEVVLDELDDERGLACHGRRTRLAVNSSDAVRRVHTDGS